MSPRVNPREALAGCSQIPTGEQVRLQKAFYPALADGESPTRPRGPRACSPSVGLCGHLVVDSGTYAWPAWRG